MIAAATARMMPDIDCMPNDDFYMFKYPRSLKYVYASYHDAFGDDEDL